MVIVLFPWGGCVCGWVRELVHWLMGWLVYEQICCSKMNEWFTDETEPSLACFSLHCPSISVLFSSGAADRAQRGHTHTHTCSFLSCLLQKQQSHPSTGLVKTARVSLNSRSSRKTAKGVKKGGRQRDGDGERELVGRENGLVTCHHCINPSHCLPFPRIKSFYQTSWEIEPVWHSGKIRCMGIFAPGWRRVYWKNSLLAISALIQARTRFVDGPASARVTCWKAVVTYHNAMSYTKYCWCEKQTKANK